MRFRAGFIFAVFAMAWVNDASALALCKASDGTLKLRDIKCQKREVLIIQPLLVC